MKKITFTFFIVFITLTSFSQKYYTWFNVGGRAGFGSSLFVNNDCIEDDQIEYKYFSPSYFFEGRIGIMFGDYVGISGGIGKNYFSQGYTITPTTNPLERNIKLDAVSYVFHLNFQAPTGFFFDIGPRFLKVTNATITNSGLDSRTTIDLTPVLEQNIISADFGLGFTAYISDNLALKTGIRGNYSLKNIVTKPGYILPTGVNTYYLATYTDERTHLTQLTFSMELTYTFGRVGKASCGRTRFMFN